jgi:hypothetical protein
MPQSLVIIEHYVEGMTEISFQRLWNSAEILFFLSLDRECQGATIACLQRKFDMYNSSKHL